MALQRPTAYPVWQVSVTRAQYSLPDLLLTDPVNGYYVARNGIGPGPATFRKITATSPFLEGRYLVSRVRDMQIFKLDIRVKGVDIDWMDYQIRTVIDAMTQDRFALTVLIDSVAHVWNCECADGWSIGTGGQFDDLQAGAYNQLIEFNIPRFPTPLGGRF